MYETSREAFVFQYQDLHSSDIKYIAIDDLATCDWEEGDRGYIVEPVVVTQNKTKQTSTAKITDLKMVKGNTDIHLNVENGNEQEDDALVNIPAAIKQGCKRNSSGGTYQMEFGLPKSVFDVEVLDLGFKRNKRK